MPDEEPAHDIIHLGGGDVIINGTKTDDDTVETPEPTPDRVHPPQPTVQQPPSPPTDYWSILGKILVPAIVGTAIIGAAYWAGSRDLREMQDTDTDTVNQLEIYRPPTEDT